MNSGVTYVIKTSEGHRKFEVVKELHYHDRLWKGAQMDGKMGSAIGSLWGISRAFSHGSMPILLGTIISLFGLVVIMVRMIIFMAASLL